MSSSKFSELLGPDAIELLAGAVTDVAEKHFFAAAERASSVPSDPLPGATASWLEGTVRFEENDCVGTVSCVLPEELARALFDAFSGRDPLDAAPPPEDLFDLVGEFSNMICGTWLTRMVKGASFDLSAPEVRSAPNQLASDDATGAGLVMNLNDLPLRITIRSLE
jgi:hypothetical protein